MRFTVLFSKYNATFLSVFDATSTYHEKLRCLAVVRKHGHNVNVCAVLSFHLYVKEKKQNEFSVIRLLLVYYMYIAVQARQFKKL